MRARHVPTVGLVSSHLAIGSERAATATLAFPATCATLWGLPAGNLGATTRSKRNSLRMSPSQLATTFPHQRASPPIFGESPRSARSWKRHAMGGVRRANQRSAIAAVANLNVADVRPSLGQRCNLSSRNRGLERRMFDAH